MGRKKKRNKPVTVDSTKMNQPKKTAKEALTAAPKALKKRPSQLATYVLCGVMFAAGVLAQKTFDRWKQRQDFAMKRSKQTESRADAPKTKF